MSKKPSAPVQWIGGKGNLREKILPLIPNSKTYVEPFGGAANVLLGRDPSEIEVYNDFDNRLVNLFRVMQNKDQFEILKHKLEHTLYSREEHREAYRLLDLKQGVDPVDKAWAFFVGQNQGFGGKPDDKTWGQRFTYNSSQAWFRRLTNLDWWHERFKNVMVENRDARDIIKYWDREEVVLYCDPPYVPETRADSSLNFYSNEPDAAYHEELVDLWIESKAAVVVSGYPNEIYKRLEENGWERKDFETVVFLTGRTENVSSDTELKRIESLWRNKKAIQLCNENSSTTKFGDLFTIE